MNRHALHDDGWRVSRYSNAGGSCVAVKFAERDTILVRDSKDRSDASPILSMSSSGWASLLKNISNHA